MTESVADGVELDSKEKDDGLLDVQSAGESVPFVGKGAKAAGSAGDSLSAIYGGIKGEKDGGDVAIAAGQLVSQGAGFAAECAAEAAAAALDPVAWLVENGLNFLLELFQPLQDALHFVTGDGPALEEAAGNFDNIAQGFLELKDSFLSDGDKALEKWTEDAGTAAKNKIAEFATGIEGVGGAASGVSETLRMWSMVMKIIEDVIKAIITEVISFAIYTWLPALATSIVSFGSSVAAAMAATVAKVASALAKVTKKVTKLSKLLDDFAKFLVKFADNMKATKTMMKALKEGGGTGLEASKKATDLAAELAGKTTKQKLAHMGKEGLKAGGGKAVESTIGIDPTNAPGSTAEGVKAAAGHVDTVLGHAKTGKEISDAGEAEDQHTPDETRSNLDMGEPVEDQPGVRRIRGNINEDTPR